MGVKVKGLSVLWIIGFLSVAGLVAESSDLRLLEAVERGDKKAVRSLLEQHADVNAPQPDGATALHWAAHRDDLETADLLIRAGANVNVANDYGVTPLSLACTNRNAAMVDRLLQAGADANAAKPTEETVLMTCARTGTVQAVKSLLVHAANPNAQETRRGQTALMWALAEKHSQVVSALIEHGADVHARSKTGFTPLLFAAQQGDLESAQLLQGAGADVNAATPEHGNVLTVASASGHEALSIFLLDKGAEPNTADGNGVTPLHHAMQRALAILNGLKYDPYYRPEPPNMPELVQALLAHGADPNAQITKGYLLGPNEVSISMVGATPFFLAAVSADAAIMRVLAADGADPKIRTEENIPPLMAAAGAARGLGQGTIRSRTGSPEEAVKVAVQLGADVNAYNKQGQTAMHAAASTGEDAIVQFLADHGAKVDAVDESGQTPWTMAMGISPILRYRGSYGSYQSTADLLLKLGARPRTREEMDTRSPLSRPDQPDKYYQEPVDPKR